MHLCVSVFEKFLFAVPPLVMESGQHLLLFAVLPLLVRSQEVYMTPRKVSFGDSVYLTCNTSEKSVKWYKNENQIGSSKTWKVELETSKDLGDYSCKTSEGKSKPFNIRLEESNYSAELSIETGRPVMWVGGGVILRLKSKDSLRGWRCYVYRGGEKPNMILLDLRDNNHSIAFQTVDLNVPETIYWCTDKSRSQRSNQITLRTSDVVDGETSVGLVVGLLLAVLLVLLGVMLVVVLLVLRRKRTATGGVYEEVALSSRKKGDDTHDPGASGSQMKSGEYEALKKEGMKEGVYHTLGVEGAAGQEGGYEALKKEGMKEGVYHALGVEGAAGQEGGYEALKKEGMKEGVYHALGVEGAAGGEGGYEALKKEGMEGPYQTLGVEGAAGGEGGYEALKKEGMKEGVYHSLQAESQ